MVEEKKEVRFRWMTKNEKVGLVIVLIIFLVLGYLSCACAYVVGRTNGFQDGKEYGNGTMKTLPAYMSFDYRNDYSRYGGGLDYGRTN